MTDDHSFEEPTILATYSNRRDAELAKGHLEEQDIASFILADDAGGTHPQFQLTQGVRLLVRRGEVSSARQVLQDADALSRVLSEEEADYEVDGTRTWRDLGTALMGIGVAVVILGVAMGNGGIAVSGLCFGLAGGIARWRSTRAAAGSAATA